MKKSVLLGTGILATALLTGCGGSSSSGGASVKEYDLSDYQERTDLTATLAGTWVAVGTGSSSSNTASSSFATKEYFVIRETVSGYEKARCEYGFEELAVTGDQIFVEHDTDANSTYVDRLTGTVSNNSKISVTSKIADTDPNDAFTMDTQLVALKISDSVDSLGSVSFNYTVNGQVAPKASLDVYCVQQTNGVGSVEGVGSTSGLTYDFGAESSRALLADRGGISDNVNTYVEVAEELDFDTEDGESVSFEVTGETALTLSMGLSGESATVSGTGTVQIQLPN